ncbi:BON domain-containing protein [Massilia sp. H6]|uniref:BON domain-containing protein n=1 Tax=Massilia sp. H6 TaxID=2970464 RepID=UPI002167E6D0|nr:BON domain-containing protein [Massilia sp. H6]UVW28931.1 BON domain-containing protein [Massilia sp. H6]
MNLSYRLYLILAGLLFAALTACAPTSTRQGTGEYIDDAVITGRVKAALAADREVKATEVQVDTFKGTVQLSGFVESSESAARAAQIAREVPGVKEVHSAMVSKEARRQ